MKLVGEILRSAFRNGIPAAIRFKGPELPTDEFRIWTPNREPERTREMVEMIATVLDDFSDMSLSNIEIKQYPKKGEVVNYNFDYGDYDITNFVNPVYDCIFISDSTGEGVYLSKLIGSPEELQVEDYSVQHFIENIAKSMVSDLRSDNGHRSQKQIMGLFVNGVEQNMTGNMTFINYNYNPEDETDDFSDSD